MIKRYLILDHLRVFMRKESHQLFNKLDMNIMKKKGKLISKWLKKQLKMEISIPLSILSKEVSSNY